MNQKQFWLSAILSSLVMGTIMSGVLSGYRIGFDWPQWKENWQTGFCVAWPLALFLNLTILPKIRQLAHWLGR
ncbi:DUF2798 domain-containing protein [Vibrio porteresiae]|uniref:DUF2798 domain-containing protein n=1 Tax=Vibrio porteresiae DSM 19223 TaxID=1123496 RepID=A0ABZ0QM42_9VIBR|nr:DUF2798 domain-containing protein [Vibrio porteresiae]WPC76747.1 DUF2798 domain-containing protein [Vibrio porteresiae DSM 19223]